jgi:tetratricopeptide (TPR) repeat protein
MKIHQIAVGLCLTVFCQGPLGRSDSSAAESPAVVRDSAPGHPKPSNDSGTGEDDLGQAAVCVEKGDSVGAAEHFRQHLRKYPDQIMIRAYLAELLAKMNRLAEARDQFERFIADAQLAQTEGPARDHVLHCHTRLMEIAVKRGDAYEERLQRGIGMVILARRLDASSDAGEESAFRERMLCKAAAELTAARRLRPDEPRPHWYLVEVWTKLGQARAAQQEMRHARALAALMPLPAGEQSALLAAR